MSWLTEWKAISAQIEGLLEASRFYIESLRSASRDLYMVGNRELLPHIKKICDALEKFRDTHKESIPTDAAESLTAVLDKIHKSFPNLKGADAFNHVHVMVTLLVSFRAEFEYHISDSAVAKRLSERAFTHLQRSIVVDSELRRKWNGAFEIDEPACERLGAVHLLLHGIWAFKVNTAGERTDLVFNEPILVESSSVERAAEALVLTEWKRVLSPTKTEAMASDARKQAARYTVGALGGVELARYRFIVLVSKETLMLPEDHLENGVVYRHINVTVDPKSPSKG